MPAVPMAVNPGGSGGMPAQICVFSPPFSFSHFRSIVGPETMLAHVAINPGQGMLHLAKDSGILAKYGFSAEVVLIPGTPRTIQALIAGDLDYVAAGAPASLRRAPRAPSDDSFDSVQLFIPARLRQTGFEVEQFHRIQRQNHRRDPVRLGRRYVSCAPRCASGHQGIRSDYFANGRHARRRARTGVGPHRGRGARRFGYVAGFSRRAKPFKGGSAREMGFRGTDAPLTTTDRKIKGDRGAVIRFMQAYLETVHYFQTNKAGTARILKKYMRGVSEEHISLWCDDLRPISGRFPTPTKTHCARRLR